MENEEIRTYESEEIVDNDVETTSTEDVSDPERKLSDGAKAGIIVAGAAVLTAATVGVVKGAPKLVAKVKTKCTEWKDRRAAKKAAKQAEEPKPKKQSKAKKPAVSEEPKPEETKPKRTRVKKTTTVE